MRFQVSYRLNDSIKRFYLENVSVQSALRIAKLFNGTLVKVGAE